eukprot:CAMPEP_0171964168 /NCGR_PEP_ID=MMETSP0993-20121228/179818_1 /TAXON_ID=483369 /ORGANISM="non described non described, Strain CCMP2098" /LENGTH=93 /DNA_ID=CAMNT_0012612947 /DNA_START=230 /DNA_END=508 /DNA_ORIENTATION=-
MAEALVAIQRKTSLEAPLQVITHHRWRHQKARPTGRGIGGVVIGGRMTVYCNTPPSAEAVAVPAGTGVGGVVMGGRMAVHSNTQTPRTSFRHR